MDMSIVPLPATVLQQPAEVTSAVIVAMGRRHSHTTGPHELQLLTPIVATVVSLDPLPTAILPHVPILLPIAEARTAAVAVAASEAVAPVAAVVVAVAVLPVADTLEVVVNNMYNS